MSIIEEYALYKIEKIWAFQILLLIASLDVDLSVIMHNGIQENGSCAE